MMPSLKKANRKQRRAQRTRQTGRLARPPARKGRMDPDSDYVKLQTLICTGKLDEAAELYEKGVALSHPKDIIDLARKPMDDKEKSKYLAFLFHIKPELATSENLNLIAAKLFGETNTSCKADSVRVLQSYGFDINTACVPVQIDGPTKDATLMTPLSAVCNRPFGNNALTSLIELGADVQADAQLGLTGALVRCQWAKVHILVKNGADCNFDHGEFYARTLKSFLNEQFKIGKINPQSLFNSLAENGADMKACAIPTLRMLNTFDAKDVGDLLPFYTKKVDSLKLPERDIPENVHLQDGMARDDKNISAIDNWSIRGKLREVFNANRWTGRENEAEKLMEQVFPHMQRPDLVKAIHLKRQARRQDKLSLKPRKK